jgi:uncharacterized protein YjbJ (UPF0337 family)
MRYEHRHSAKPAVVLLTSSLQNILTSGHYKKLLDISLLTTSTSKHITISTKYNTLAHTMTERLSNTANSYIGSAKQTLGETIGHSDLAANGAAQKAQAESAQRLADAKTRADGLGLKVQGEAEAKVGSLTGDKAMEARGQANEAMGDIQRNV